MFKNKTIKLFLMLGVILFSLIGVVGCNNPSVSVNVNATYIRTHFEDDEGNGKFTIVNNHIDLVSLLENDTPEKYNEDFFETKSLLFFKIVESSSGNISEIESYEIIDKTLNIYVKTKQYGDTYGMGCWWFILELSKEDVEKFDNVKIFKNGEKIMDENRLTILPKMYYMDVIDMSSSMTFNCEKPNYGYVSLNRTSSYIYDFNNEQVYELVSAFNNIPIFHAETITKREELDKLKINGIMIEVSYRYINRNNCNNDAIVHFYILENGMLLFEDNRKINLYYSDIGIINYDEIKNQIIQIGGRI